MNTAWLEEQKPALNGCKNKKEIEGGDQQFGEEGQASGKIFVSEWEPVEMNGHCSR